MVNVSKRTQTAFALALVGGMASLGNAHAQITQGRSVVNNVKNMQANAEANPLPDVDAIERGENPPASASFSTRRVNASGGNKGPQGVQSSSTTSTPIRVSRSEATGGGDTDGGDAPVRVLGDTGGYGYADEAPARQEVPELHTVENGDTLWSLCVKYFGDAYKWPELWSLNPLVTNPHWIFPGDVIRLKDGGGLGTSTSEQDLDITAPTLLSGNSGGGGNSGAVMLREMGFLEGSDLRAAGKISGSREEKILLSTGDSVYINFPKDKPLRAGERYTLFSVDTEKPILAKDEETVLGYLVRIQGDVVIDQIADETTGRGTLVDIVVPVERGALISNQIKQFKRVQQKPSDVNVRAQIVGSFSPTNMLSADNFVVLSRGEKDGLRVGNRSFVIRRGDGYAPLMEGWETFDNRFPKEVVAELLVVNVHDHASVAWVSRSVKEIRVGETSELRKGY